MSSLYCLLHLHQVGWVVVCINILVPPFNFPFSFISCSPYLIPFSFSLFSHSLIPFSSKFYFFSHSFFLQLIIPFHFLSVHFPISYVCFSSNSFSNFLFPLLFRFNFPFSLLIYLFFHSPPFSVIHSLLRRVHCSLADQ